MLKIAICDDDTKFTVRMENILRDVAYEKGFQIGIDTYLNGVALIENMNNSGCQYEIIFMDIVMKRMNGLETARLIRKFNEFVYVIFVTSHQEYAIEAYEVQPFRFILKPIDEEVVKKSFLQAYEKIRGSSFCFEYKFNKVCHRILIKDIMFFESNKRVVKIHLANGSVRSYYDTLNRVEQNMKQFKVNFLRIHKSLFINAKYIREKTYDRVTLTDGTVHFIGESRRKNINMQYAQMVERNMVGK